MDSVAEMLEKIKKREKDVKEVRARMKNLKGDEEDIKLEVKNLDEEDEKKEENHEEEEFIDLNETFPLSMTSTIIEKTVDEQRRTVVAGILQEDTLSSNNRFYPAKVVRKAIRTLEGKRSLIGHDTNNPSDIVAKVVKSFMKNGVGFGEFKFGTDPQSESILSKIKEGLIDSTSIRASGVTRRGKINNEFVDVVEKLDIFSVDWVVEGGVSAAKVVQVFEQSPTITYEDDNKVIHQEEDVEKVDKLEVQLAEQNKKMDELLKVNEKLKTDNAESDKKLVEQKLETYVNKKLAVVQDDEIRSLVKEQLTGNSEKQIDEQFARQVKYHEAIREKAGLKSDDIHIVPVDKNESDEEITFHNVNGFMESKKIPKSVKFEALTKHIFK